MRWLTLAVLLLGLLYTGAQACVSCYGGDEPRAGGPDVSKLRRIYSKPLPTSSPMKLRPIRPDAPPSPKPAPSATPRKDKP